MVRGLLVAVVAVLCVVAGCAAPVVGTPTAAPVKSDRPREIRLDGIDPCTLLSKEQQARLGLTERSILDVRKSLVYPGETKLCSTRGERPRSIALGIFLVVTAGIGVYSPDRTEAKLTPIRVRGFPALQVTNPDFLEMCTVIVDVADGQLVDIQFADGGGVPQVPQPDLCAGAQQSAGEVMDSLLAR